MQKNPIGRREFLRASTSITTSALAIPVIAQDDPSREIPQDGINVIGPREGYSPHIGTLVSMLTWMRSVILEPVHGMTVKQLDYIHDNNSNSIGAMLLHLAATERFYQANTFDSNQGNDIDKNEAELFDVAMNLGERARKKIKGHNLKFYTDILEKVRTRTLNELKKRDDNWLLTVDKTWGWGPTNNYCKWFHVCEHESNHNGQIKWIKGRLPV